MRRKGLSLVASNTAGTYAATDSSVSDSTAVYSPGPSLPADEAIEQLRKLGELKKEGLLTYEQFEAQKQRLLS
jgi:hypothetical protein